MINKLLWRCPVCKTDDAIIHRKRLIGPDRVSCSVCGSVWKLRRNRGGVDYDFSAIAGPMAGVERPLAEWYDLMREGFDFAPKSDSLIPLEMGEVLYLRGNPESLVVLRPDPRFQTALAQVPSPPRPAAPGGPAMINLGSADLFLTDRRLVARHNDESYSLPLDTIRSVDLIIDRFVVVRHAQRLMELFEFIEESPLKWRAYLELALRPVSEAHGVHIRMAHD